ncbi:hypothetical protein [Clostridium estertheticum]|uniref:hypothetical protein n=1 Tax=Clostridium estertheticum TaxID=238834 RepID=UPI001C0B92B6|nr:hypothetical protein [Clostridium estertheticum]MBU3187222.1 hypothetical protein [Clostridium estertheticum]
MGEKKVGRKQRFTYEALENILDSYFDADNNKIYGQTTATKIAEYAEKTLGIEGIKYYHFNRNEKIKTRIHETNNIYKFDQTTENENTLVAFNPDRFLELYKNDPRMMKIVLRRFSDKYETLNRNVLDLQTLKLKYETNIIKLENENNLLNKKLKDLININNATKTQSKKLEKFKKFSEKGVMLKYLKDQGLINSLDEENLSILLANCDLIDSNDNVVPPNIDLETYYKHDDNLNDDDNNEAHVLNMKEYKNPTNKDTVTNAMDVLNKHLQDKKKKD